MHSTSHSDTLVQRIVLAAPTRAPHCDTSSQV
jgi:hypothetical protein